MKTIYYQDGANETHIFPIKESSLVGILSEFESLDNYLKSLGVKFLSCGVK